MKKILIKFVIITVGLMLVALITAWLAGLSPGMVYSEGHRSGVIYKFSKKGVFYKTWEGELSLGMTETDSGGAIVPRVFEFSVTDPKVIEKIDEAERIGKRVTLHYREYIWRGRYYGTTAYDILDVKE